jgi:hypothetical protein
VDFGGITVLLETLGGFLDVLLLLAEEIESGRVMLEEVGADTEPDAGAPSRDNVHLSRKIWDVGVGVECVAASKHDLLYLGWIDSRSIRDSNR